MLILFNTAYRIGYLKNVLTTIFLPQGATNEYRYSVGDGLHVSEAEAKSYDGLRGERVLICYGDRFGAGGYKFHPIRFGTLVKVEITGGKAYFRVCLEDHVSCDSVEEFTARIYELDADAAFPMLQLTNADPLYARDGRYVIKVADRPVVEILKSNEHSWHHAAIGLSRTKAFAEAESRIIFAKCEVFANGSRRRYKGNWISAEREADLRLSISYLFPGQQANSAAAARLVVTSPPNVVFLGSTDRPLGMPEDKIEIPFAVEGERKLFTLSTKFLPSAGDSDVVGPDDAVSIQVTDSKLRTYMAILFVGVYVLGAVGSATGEYRGWGEVLKAVGLTGIFLTLGGKKIV